MFRVSLMALLVSAIYLVIGCESLSESLPTAPSLTSSGAVSNTSSNPIVKAKEAFSALVDTPSNRIPERINGFELQTIRGWHGNTYPWKYDPATSAVHPVPRLWNSDMTPSPFQVMEQCQQIRQFGGGAVVLEYSPNPALPWHNYWLSVDFGGNCGLPFYLLYEEINGTRFIPPDGDSGPKNMSLEYNRKVFKEDIRFIWENVIWDPIHNIERYPGRYVIVDGRAVIYMWATGLMVGDFASLLEEVKAEYPIFFIGDEGYPPSDSDKEGIERTMALDGIMSYTLGGGVPDKIVDGKGYTDYLKRVQDYRHDSFEWRKFFRKTELKTGKRHIFIPTFQAAYDDSHVPGRTTPIMYPRSREEVGYHAELIRSGMGTIYNNVGPFVVQGELPEGAAVIESQCLPPRAGYLGTLDQPGRWVGCGTARLEILKIFFSY